MSSGKSKAISRISGSRGLPRLALLLLALHAFAATQALAERKEPPPRQLEDVGVTEHLNGPLPLQLSFFNEEGKPVALGSYFKAGRPVILTLNYYACPMLCTLQLNGLVKALKELPWTPGHEFEIVTVSIDPKEKPKLAKEKKATYIGQYGNPAVNEGWHFLTGEAANIHTLATALGFRYHYDEKTGQFAHAAVAFVSTPEGRISRYLYGIDYSPRTLRLSLVEAAAGKIGSSFDQLLLYCYHYDASRGRYAPVAMNVMRIGGLLTMVGLGCLVGGYWLKERRRRRVNRG